MWPCISIDRRMVRDRILLRPTATSFTTATTGLMSAGHEDLIFALLFQ